MKHAMKPNKGSNSQARASIVDGKLILSLPHALTPVVWQMDLAQAKASALEVRDNKDEGSSALVLKTARGETTEIAPFEKKSDAIDALMAVSRALESAHGQIRGGAASAGEIPTAAPATQPRKRGKWIAIVLGLLMLLVLINLWGAMLPSTPRGFETSPLSPVSQTGNAGGGDQNGVPVSADEFLKTP